MAESWLLPALHLQQLSPHLALNSLWQEGECYQTLHQTRLLKGQNLGAHCSLIAQQASPALPLFCCLEWT